MMERKFSQAFLAKPPVWLRSQSKSRGSVPSAADEIVDQIWKAFGHTFTVLVRGVRDSEKDSRYAPPAAEELDPGITSKRKVTVVEWCAIAMFGLALCYSVALVLVYYLAAIHSYIEVSIMSADNETLAVTRKIIHSLLLKMASFYLPLTFTLKAVFCALAGAIFLVQRRWVVMCVLLAAFSFDIYPFLTSWYFTETVSPDAERWIDFLPRWNISDLLIIAIVHTMLDAGYPIVRSFCYGGILVIAIGLKVASDDAGGTSVIVALAYPMLSIVLLATLVAFFPAKKIARFCVRQRSVADLEESNIGSRPVDSEAYLRDHVCARSGAPLAERNAQDSGHTIGRVIDDRNVAAREEGAKQKPSEGGRQKSTEEKTEVLFVDVELAYRGGIYRATIIGREVDVNVPRGIQSGQKLRFSKFYPDGRELVVEIQLRSDGHFRTTGRDVFSSLHVNAEAVLSNREVVVQTLGGPVTMTLPLGCAIGAKLRLKGRGLPAGRGGGLSGDHIVEIEISDATPDLGFCTRCGSGVKAYEWNKHLGGNYWEVSDDKPHGHQGPDHTEYTTYWCSNCARALFAQANGDTGSIHECGHFSPWYSKFCGSCGVLVFRGY